MTASDIYAENDRSDFYHLHRYAAAMAMVVSDRGNWNYSGQWSSGTCIFHHPTNDNTATVSFPNHRATISIS